MRVFYNHKAGIIVTTSIEKVKDLIVRTKPLKSSIDPER